MKKLRANWYLTFFGWRLRIGSTRIIETVESKPIFLMCWKICRGNWVSKICCSQTCVADVKFTISFFTT